MILKKITEDFVVKEIPLIEPVDKGKYCICELTKKNRNTEEAVLEIAKQLKIQRERVGYAGNKDKQAITTQIISILVEKNKLANFNHKDMSIKFLGFAPEPLSLGKLKGNKFTITVRDLSGLETIPKDLSQMQFINYFHTQRFSDNNIVVGKLLLKKDYAGAIKILIEDNSWSENIKKHLAKSKNDYVGALKTLPKKILILFVHAFQSELWNRAVKELIDKNILPSEVPIPGFGGFSATPEVKQIVDHILSQEGIVFQDFLNRDIAFLSVEGTSRNTFVTPKNLIVSDFLDDELNQGRKKLILNFELGKGEYATNIVEQLFQ